MNSHNTSVSHVSPLVTYVPGALWVERGPEDGNRASVSAVEKKAFFPANEIQSSSPENITYHSTNATLGEGRAFFSWFGSRE